MKIELVRHFKVNYKWKSFYNSNELNKAFIKYDSTEVINTFYIKNKYKKVYISTLIRSKFTSDFLENKDEIIKTSLIDEIRPNAYFNTNIRIPTKIWYITWIILWKLNIPLVSEIRKETLFRINEFIDLLEKDNDDVTVVGHAFLFSILIKELKNRNYKGALKPKYFKNGELRVYEK